MCKKKNKVTVSTGSSEIVGVRVSSPTLASNDVRIEETVDLPTNVLKKPTENNNWKEMTSLNIPQSELELISSL